MAGRHVGAAIGNIIRQRFLAKPPEARLKAIRRRLWFMAFLYTFLAVNTLLFLLKVYWLGIVTIPLFVFSFVLYITLPFALVTAHRDKIQAKKELSEDQPQESE